MGPWVAGKENHQQKFSSNLQTANKMYSKRNFCARGFFPVVSASTVNSLHAAQLRSNHLNYWIWQKKPSSSWKELHALRGCWIQATKVVPGPSGAIPLMSTSFHQHIWQHNLTPHFYVKEAFMVGLRSQATACWI